ncbi:FAD-dependent oxidoreductase [Chloroflexota bacterium]
MTSKAKFKKLFEPFRIGEISLRNRIVMSAVSPFFGTEDGYVTERTKDFFEERAKGGVGIIIIEGICVQWPIGKTYNRILAIDDDKFVPGLSELAQVIRKHGAKPALQLQHAGRENDSRVRGGLQAIAPSPIASPSAPELPRELTVGEIRDIVRLYAEGAKRAKNAGFEAIEINGHGGYLVNQFLSRFSNKRHDAYGGSLQNRVRFLTEIIQAIKESNGEDYPVWCRIVGRDYGIEDGITIEEGREIAQLVENAGANAIHVTAYGVGVQGRVAFPDSAGTLVPLAEGIKKVVGIPVITHGRIGPELGERILREGKADLIAMCRALVADPELPNKVASGRLDDIVPCTACLHCQDSALSRGEEMKCRINAAVGREREYRIKPAERAKKVLVVGGGPAGMEAARVAALRGHKVLLYEKRPRLGGQALLARIIHNKMDYKDDIKSLVRYLSIQIRKLGVKVRLGKEVNPALIEQIKPDVVILATGAVPSTPKIRGINRGNMTNAGQIHHKVNFWLRFLTPETIAWLSRFWLPFGRRVVIMGGGIAGCQLAGFLTKRGKKVTITEASPRFANDMVRMYRRILLNSLAEEGTIMLRGVRYEEITERGLIITDEGGNRQTLEADTIVSVVGSEPNTELFKALEGKVPEIYLAGDCVEPNLILEAIHDGSRIARAV